MAWPIFCLTGRVLSYLQVQPEWMFDQCVITMAQVASTNAIESPIEHMIIEAEQDCLLKLTDL